MLTLTIHDAERDDLIASTSRASVECVRLAGEQGVHLAIAESLTGGLVNARVVDTPGASKVLYGGVVAYDTGVKQSVLGVGEKLLEEFGPVHPEVARQMAQGVRPAASPSGSKDAEIGLATTGVAGPDPDPQSGQPAGTVFIGLAWGTASEVLQLRCGGSRSEIRDLTVAVALRWLNKCLENKEIAAYS